MILCNGIFQDLLVPLNSTVNKCMSLMVNLRSALSCSRQGHLIGKKTTEFISHRWIPVFKNLLDTI